MPRYTWEIKMSGKVAIFCSVEKVGRLYKTNCFCLGEKAEIWWSERGRMGNKAVGRLGKKQKTLCHKWPLNLCTTYHCSTL